MLRNFKYFTSNCHPCWPSFAVDTLQKRLNGSLALGQTNVEEAKARGKNINLHGQSKISIIAIAVKYYFRV